MIAEVQFLNQLPLGTLCQERLNGARLIVCANPASKHIRHQNSVKVYDTGAELTRIIDGDTAVFIKQEGV